MPWYAVGSAYTQVKGHIWPGWPVAPGPASGGGERSAAGRDELPEPVHPRLRLRLPSVTGRLGVRQLREKPQPTAATVGVRAGELHDCECALSNEKRQYSFTFCS